LLNSGTLNTETFPPLTLLQKSKTEIIFVYTQSFSPVTLLSKCRVYFSLSEQAKLYLSYAVRECAKIQKVQEYAPYDTARSELFVPRRAYSLHTQTIRGMKLGTILITEEFFLVKNCCVKTISSNA
jgi:hypothetical protein